MVKNSIIIRSFLIVFTSTVFIVGIWHTGHGAWIYMKAELAQYLLERAWTETLAGNRHVSPWPWADTWPIARLLVPQHHIDMFVLAGASGRTLAFGPGHVSSSALPGTKGTTILNGHRDTHFTFLEKIQTGDVMIVEQTNGFRTRYTVRDMKIVDARHAVIFHDESKPQLVLITCYPFDAIAPGSPLRYVVDAEKQTSQTSYPD